MFPSISSTKRFLIEDVELIAIDISPNTHKNHVTIQRKNRIATYKNLSDTSIRRLTQIAHNLVVNEGWQCIPQEWPTGWCIYPHPHSPLDVGEQTEDEDFLQSLTEDYPELAGVVDVFRGR